MTVGIIGKEIRGNESFLTARTYEDISEEHEILTLHAVKRRC